MSTGCCLGTRACAMVVKGEILLLVMMVVMAKRDNRFGVMKYLFETGPFLFVLVVERTGAAL